MLLRFGVQNFLSLRDPQELSLIASPLKDDATSLISSPALNGHDILPAAVIYGANASGKSNLVKALSFMRKSVLFSHSRSEPGGGVSRTPFALDPQFADRPSHFDIDFIVDGVRHHYGFQASNEAYEAEWLYAFPNGVQRNLFERRGQDFKFGRALKGQNNIIKELTRPNSLFISTAAQNNHEYLTNVLIFFRLLRCEVEFSAIQPVIMECLSVNKNLSRVISIIKDIVPGISSYKESELQYDDQLKEMQAFLDDFFRRFLPDMPRDTKKALETIQLSHKNVLGEDVYFDIEQESSGTQRLLILASCLLRALDEGSVLVIDELDASLHTKACEAILMPFMSRETNRRGAQIIATTHDTNLLSSNLLRRDQVWFTELNNEGATQLYALTDIRTRKGDNLEKGYLQGRYGAVPFLGRTPNLALEH